MTTRRRREHKTQPLSFSQTQRREEAIRKVREEQTKRRDAVRRLQLDDLERRGRAEWTAQAERSLAERFADGLALTEVGRTPRKERTTLMQPQWMIEPPEDLANSWLAMPRPEGKRCLVEARDGKTVSRLKKGGVLHAGISFLPGGAARGEGPCLLDCIYHEMDGVYYVMDLLCWNGVWVTECEALFRLYWIAEKLKECRPLEEVSLFMFEAVRFWECSASGLLAALYDFVPFVRDGICLLYKEGPYVQGHTELSLLWKDATCSRYLVDTDMDGHPTAHQIIFLRLGTEGGLYTGDDPPVQFADVRDCCLDRLAKPDQLKPEKLLRLTLHEGPIDEEDETPRLRFEGFVRNRRRGPDLLSKILFQKEAREGKIQASTVLQRTQVPSS